MLGHGYKQVLVIRSDLKLSRGKTAAQAAHAAVSASEEARKLHRAWWAGWMEEGQRKIVVKVKNEEELLRLQGQAKAYGLPNALIVDKGLTEVPPGTVTCLGIGPAPEAIVDKLTGSLPLL
jgi:PTH2 family peptidyl-tRNA hydrolase